MRPSAAEIALHIEALVELRDAAARENLARIRRGLLPALACSSESFDGVTAHLPDALSSATLSAINASVVARFDASSPMRIDDLVICRHLTHS
jgi:hypothetical protein